MNKAWIEHTIREPGNFTQPQFQTRTQAWPGRLNHKVDHQFVQDLRELPRAQGQDWVSHPWGLRDECDLTRRWLNPIWPRRAAFLGCSQGRGHRDKGNLRAACPRSTGTCFYFRNCALFPLSQFEFSTKFFLEGLLIFDRRIKCLSNFAFRPRLRKEGIKSDICPFVLGTKARYHDAGGTWLHKKTTL